MCQPIELTVDQVAGCRRVSPFAVFNRLPKKPSSEPEANGTGFFITDDGFFITNNHVVKDAAKIRVLTDAGLLDAMVVKTDAANDLAL